MAASDTVLIHDLTVDCSIGDLPHEREHAQRVRFDLTLATDCAPAAASDQLADAVDYVAASETVTRVAVEGRFRLVEALAERTAEALLASYPITAVTVRVRKASAVPAAGWVGVEIRRERPCRSS